MENQKSLLKLEKVWTYMVLATVAAFPLMALYQTTEHHLFKEGQRFDYTLRVMEKFHLPLTFQMSVSVNFLIAFALQRQFLNFCKYLSSHHHDMLLVEIKLYCPGAFTWLTRIRGQAG